MQEFEGIAMAKKDYPANLEKTTNWMKAQPDFNDTTNIFLNQCIGYNPRSKIFQALTTSMWERYSLELDSWRDQPLYSYCVHHFNFTPLELDHSLFSIFGMGHGGHKYNEMDDK